LDFNILWLFRKPTTQISRLHNSAKKFWVDFCTDALKGNLHSFSFPWMHIYVLKILQIFLHVWICWVRAFYKCIIYYISRTFRYKTSFGNKYVRKCKFAKFFCRLIKRCPRAFQTYIICYRFVSQEGNRRRGGALWSPQSNFWVNHTSVGIGRVKASSLISVRTNIRQNNVQNIVLP